MNPQTFLGACIVLETFFDVFLTYRGISLAGAGKWLKFLQHQLTIKLRL